jgi:nucleoid-associated protein YgaU
VPTSSDQTVKSNNRLHPAGGSSDKPASNPADRSAAIESHLVQPGETLASIAKNYYGSEKHARFLKSNNPDVGDPNRLSVGTKIRIPALSESVADSAGNAPAASARKTGAARTYRVQAGDSFYSVAKRELGDASRWKEVFALNKELVKGDATQLQIGQILTLPER